MLNIEQMTNKKGQVVVNQHLILTDAGDYFQSYNSIIAFIPMKGQIQLDIHLWDCSTTTGKYRNLFLGETKKVTEKKIASGEYLLKDLNK